MSALAAVRFALRSLRRRPAYAAVVVTILAMGIGGCAAIFSLVDAVLLRPLPYGNIESLVVVFADGSSRGQGARLSTTPGDLHDWRTASAEVFDGLAAIRNVSVRITSLETPVVPLTHAVSANYFDVLGARPFLGRAFTAGDDTPGRNDVVMLSYPLWRSRFGGDPAIVGRTVGLDGRPYTVVGVAGPDFYSAHIFNVQPDLWIPAAFESERADRLTRDVLVYGRLRPGVARTAAERAMRAIAQQMARDNPRTNDRWSVALVPIREHAVGGFTRIATLVMAAVGLVLLIACANVANLGLVRGTERSAEVAMKAALGASRGRIVLELLAESAVLSALGGAAGIGIAAIAIPSLVRLIPPSAGIPFLQRAALDARLAGFTIAVAAACAILSGLLPSRQAGRLGTAAGWRGLGRGTLARTRGWRQGLVAVEMALAVVVIVCAVLMARTIASLDRLDTGFRPERIAKLRTGVRGDAFADPRARIRHFEELQRRLGEVGGIDRVSAVSFEPPVPAGQIGAVRLRLPGDPDIAAAARAAVTRSILPDYFETMGIPIVSGRAVTRDDTRESARVAVISRSMAARYFGGLDPIGRSFAVDAAGAMPMRIVGVSGDVFTAGPDPSPVPAFYVPYAQNPVPVMTVVMRVPRGDVAAPLREAEAVAWSLTPFSNVYAIARLSDQLGDLNWRPRFGAAVLGGFAAVAFVLAALGLYAVIAYTVVQRRREIGVRMALGGSPSAIVRGVIAGALRLAAAGILGGNLLALAFTRGLRGMLFGIAPTDPLTFALVSLAMLAVALCACALPAIAAARVNPIEALRDS